MKTANELTIREKLQVIIDDQNLTDYRLCKDTGLSLSAVRRFRNGEFKLDNITLKSVEAYLDYYDQKYSK